MRTTLIAALVAAAVPASAAAHDGGSIKHKNRFLRARVVDVASSERAPGRDIVTYGVRNGKPATARRIRSYFGTMRRMIAPRRPQPVARVRTPTVPRPVASVPAPAVPSASAPAPAAGGPERFAQCESGGDWNAVNPASGAFGRYQLMPQHYNGGMCSDLGRDPSGQTVCANRVFEAQGPGAWSQCGG